MTTIPAAHAPLAPSSAHRWGPGGCPASPRMEAQFPEDEESEASREGTAAHHYLAETLCGRVVTAGMIAPNGVPINVEMIEAAQAYIDDVRATLAAATPGLALRIEERVSAGGTIHPDNWGTPDTYLLDHAARRLHVWDYKYGHRYVDAYKNWQMLDYAICILESEGVLQSEWSPWEITLTIAQPRNYAPEGPLREWFLTGGELSSYARDLREAAEQAMARDAMCKTGPHCRDCNAAHACQALQRAALSAVDVTYRRLPAEMDGAATGVMLAILTASEERIKALRVGLEESAMVTLKRGGAVPGWKVGNVKGRTVWKQPAEAVIAMGALMGVDISAPLAAVTPKQAIKLGLDPDVIDGYAETPTGATRLEQVTDTTFSRIFGAR